MEKNRNLTEKVKEFIWQKYGKLNNLYGNMNCQNADGFQTAWSLKIILVWLKMIDPIKYMA